MIGRIRFWGVLGGLLVVLSGIDLIALAAVIVTLGQLSANNDEVTFAFDGAFMGISMSYVALKIFQDVVGIAAGIIFLRPRLWPIST